MPVIISIPPTGMPAVIDDTEEAILKALARPELGVPADARQNVETLKAWLQTLAPPSGWFETAEDAKAYQERVGRERDSQLMRAALDETGLSQRDMTDALGLADPQKDGAPVRKILLAKNYMSGPTRKALAYIVKFGPLNRDDEAAILGKMQDGAWKNVKRSSIRRA